jgi:hypothetical protein
VSLSQDPAFSTLRDNFVCGYRDISREPYCGVSGRHEVDGNAINTTNGAGPHNIQMFILSADGTVLTCLPGYWNPRDLVQELALAARLNQVWLDPTLNRGQKVQLFRQMHLAHIQQHPPDMQRRSHLQGFDAKYEAQHRLNTSDFIVNPGVARLATIKGNKIPWQAFKTTDEVMHERLAQRPFVPYSYFDVAAYVDYGRPKYDKHEDDRDGNGKVVKSKARNEPMIGNASQMQNNNGGQSMRGMVGPRGVMRLLKSAL